MNFSKLNQKSIHCVFCTKSVNVSNIRAHVSSKKHISNELRVRTNPYMTFTKSFRVKSTTRYNHCMECYVTSMQGVEAVYYHKSPFEILDINKAEGVCGLALFKQGEGSCGDDKEAMRGDVSEEGFGQSLENYMEFVCKQTPLNDTRPKKYSEAEMIVRAALSRGDILAVEKGVLNIIHPNEH